jgi:hypothetical protein
MTLKLPTLPLIVKWTTKRPHEVGLLRVRKVMSASVATQ